MAGYDPRFDAPGALALGGIGALGGLGYSLINKKQRRNKLRNALIGAAALPTAWLGGKYIASKFMSPEDQNLLYNDPISLLSKYMLASKSERDYPGRDLRELTPAERNKLLNSSAAFSYGTLGLGIGLPALYLHYLNKKYKKSLQDDDAGFDDYWLSDIS